MSGKQTSDILDGDDGDEAEGNNFQGDRTPGSGVERVWEGSRQWNLGVTKAVRVHFRHQRNGGLVRSISTASHEISVQAFGFMPLLVRVLG